MGFPPGALTLLLKTVPRDTVARNHQINSTVNPPAAPKSLPSLTWRLGSQLFWLIKYFQAHMISDLLRVIGGTGQQVPARTQLLCLPFRGGGFLRAEGEMAFRGRGPRGNRQDPPMKMRRARKRKASSLHYVPPSQHAGCSLILIGTTNNLVTSAILSIKARGMTLAGPGGQAKWEVVET